MGLPSSNRLRQQDDFRRVIASGRKAADGLFAIAAARSAGEQSRFGFSVSKRVGGAVVRNRLKRRLQEILRRQEFGQAWDIVVTARPQASGASFSDTTGSITRLIDRLKLDNAQGRSAHAAPAARSSPSGTSG